MKITAVQASALVAVFLMGSGWTLSPAHADDAAAVTAAEADEQAVDAAAGLPKFKNRAERRAYFEKMRQENPEQFQAMKQKRQEAWLAKHPEAAAKIAERRQWAKDHPEEAQKMREKFQQKLQAMKEKRREFEAGPGQGPARADYRENRRDLREDRWDAKHQGGRMDRIEDRADRREDRWDAKRGPDRGRPGHPGKGHAHGKQKQAVRKAAAAN